MNAQAVAIEKAGLGEHQRPATTSSDLSYRRTRGASTPNPRFSPAGRRTGRRPANRPTQIQRDRAALTLLGLAANLQQSASLSQAEHATGWAVFERLLALFVEMRCQRGAA